MVGVYALNARRDALAPVAGYHVPKHLLEHFLTNPSCSRFPRLTAGLARGPRAVDRRRAERSALRPRVLEGLDPHSVLFAPTPVRGEPVGALFLVWWGPARVPAAEIRLLEGVAAQVGLAMENAELSRQTAGKLQETETLLSVSRTLSSTLDLDS